MENYQESFKAIGTGWYIEFAIDGEDKAKVLLKRIHERVEEFDHHYSRFRSDSLVTQISKQSGTYTLPVDAKPLLDLYWQAYEMTNGKVTPLIGNALSDAGYDAHYSFSSKPLRSPPKLHEALDYNFPLLEVKIPILLDFGAAGKGYLVDIVSEILKEGGASSYIVDAGGDIRVGNMPQYKIGLEHPEVETQVIGVATLTNGSICGSSGSRRKWGKYNHILDPEMLESPQDYLAIWVVAENALKADMMTTCLNFTEPQTLKNWYDFEYLILKPDYSVVKSENFPAEIFLRA